IVPAPVVVGNVAYQTRLCSGSGGYREPVEIAHRSGGAHAVHVQLNDMFASGQIDAGRKRRPSLPAPGVWNCKFRRRGSSVYIQVKGAALTIICHANLGGVTPRRGYLHGVVYLLALTRRDGGAKVGEPRVRAHAREEVHDGEQNFGHEIDGAA